MKMKSTRNRSLPAFLLSMSVGLMVSTGYAAVEPYHSYKIVPGEEEPAAKGKKTKEKSSKSFSSLNNTAVKIYPDAMKRTMHVIAKENDGKDIDFFVFDLQGTLIQNYKMKAKDHVKITGLARGSYVYRAFVGDEESAAGKFEIR